MRYQDIVISQATLQNKGVHPPYTVVLSKNAFSRLLEDPILAAVSHTLNSPSNPPIASFSQQQKDRIKGKTYKGKIAETHIFV